MEAELSFHVEMRTRELVEQGIPPERARALALRRFGDYASSRRRVRRDQRTTGASHGTSRVSDRAAAGCRLRVSHAAAHAGVHRSSRSRRSRSASAPTAPSSASSTACCCAAAVPRCRPLVPRQTLYPDGTPYSLSAPDFMSVREQTRTLRAGRGSRRAIATDARRRRAARGPGRRSATAVRLARPARRARTQLCRATISPGANGTVLDHGFWQRAFGGDRSVLGRRSGSPAGLRSSASSSPGTRLLDDADVLCAAHLRQAFSASTMKGRRDEFLDVVARAKTG